MEIEFPFIPQRIAIISSRSAAGYTDFMKHLSGNSNGYVFYSSLFEAPLQGSDTERGIISALERIAGHIENFDVVVIIRGGGSQTDLSWFDNYNIAYFITQFPVPVITGIGHEKDLSVTDIVAHRSLKTPTAVADFLVECMLNAENYIIEISNKLTDRSLKIIEQTKEWMISAKMKLIPLARIMISGFREELSSTLVNMISTGKEKPAIMELTDTYLLIRRATRNTPQAQRVGRGLIPSRSPNMVATPLPPRKPA